MRQLRSYRPNGTERCVDTKNDNAPKPHFPTLNDKRCVIKVMRRAAMLMSCNSFRQFSYLPYFGAGRADEGRSEDVENPLSQKDLSLATRLFPFCFDWAIMAEDCTCEVDETTQPLRDGGNRDSGHAFVRSRTPPTTPMPFVKRQTA